MINDILKPATSSLTRFQSFSVHILISIVFGAVFLLLSQPLCVENTVCNVLQQNFHPTKEILIWDGKWENTAAFLFFSYIAGLFLFVFSRSSFKLLSGFCRWCSKNWCSKILKWLKEKVCKQQSKDSEKTVDDVDLLVYLENHELVKDVHMLNLFYSSIARFLFAITTLGLLLLFPWLHYIPSLHILKLSIVLFIIIVIPILTLLFFAQSIDREVNAFTDQIKTKVKRICNSIALAQYKVRMHC